MEKGNQMYVADIFKIAPLIVWHNSIEPDDPEDKKLIKILYNTYIKLGLSERANFCKKFYFYLYKETLKID